MKQEPNANEVTHVEVRLTAFDKNFEWMFNHQNGVKIEFNTEDINFVVVRATNQIGIFNKKYLVGIRGGPGGRSE